MHGLITVDGKQLTQISIEFMAQKQQLIMEKFGDIDGSEKIDTVYNMLKTIMIHDCDRKVTTMLTTE